MPIKYSTEAILKRIDHALHEDIANLYKAPLINWSGCSSSGINYSEIIAERLISDGIVGRILAIPEIERQNYKVDTHDGKLAKNNAQGRNICKGVV